jgi:hypothetical protein
MNNTLFMLYIADDAVQPRWFWSWLAWDAFYARHRVMGN